MKKTLILFCCCIIFFACSNNTDQKRPSTSLDTGREFIRATLDGDVEKAETFILKDTQNIRLFASYKDFYKKLSPVQKNSYKKSSYIINRYNDVNDSTTIINYSNDYMNKPMDIKLVKIDKIWNIDFAFTSGDTSNIK